MVSPSFVALSSSATPMLSMNVSSVPDGFVEEGQRSPPSVRMRVNPGAA